MTFEENLNVKINTTQWNGPLQCAGFCLGAKWAYAEAKKELGWQPIATAPKDGTVVLGCHIKNHFIRCVNWQGSSFGDGMFPIIHLTHWMPIPEPPEEEDV